MLPVVVVDLGLALGLLALVALVRPLRRLGLPTRRRALALLAAAGALALGGLFLPAPSKSVARPSSALDRIVPTWQFDERHETTIRATPEAVARAVRAVTAREIRLFRLLTWLRSPRLPGRAEPSILAPPADEPIVAVALRSGFMPLAEAPDEVVLGTLVLVPDEMRRLPPAELARRRAALTPERFAALDAPGYAKAVMNFRWVDRGDGTTRLTTETRIFATDAGARRRFAVYWRIIYPGSSAIRYAWLAAIRARAERSDSAESDP
jgi:hypothetical protein